MVCSNSPAFDDGNDMEPYASSSDDTIIYNLEAEIGQQEEGNVLPAHPATSRPSICSDPAIVLASTPSISTPADPNASESVPEEPDDMDTNTPVTAPKLKRGQPKSKAKNPIQGTSATQLPYSKRTCAVIELMKNVSDFTLCTTNGALLTHDSKAMCP